MPSAPTRRLPYLAAFVAALLLAQPASATIIGVEIITTVLSSQTTSGHTLPAPNEAVIINFSYDDAVPDTNGDPNMGQFTDAMQSFSVDFPDSNFSLSWNGGQSALTTIDDQDSGGIIFTDVVAFAVASGAISGGQLGDDDVLGLGFGLGQGEFGSPPDLVVNELPNPNGFDFDGLGVSVINISGLTEAGGGFADIITLNAGTGTILPIVPEPGMAVLLGAGLLALRRSRR